MPSDLIDLPQDPPSPKRKPPDDDRQFDKGSGDERYRINPVTGDTYDREYRDN